MAPGSYFASRCKAELIAGSHRSYPLDDQPGGGK
jgi:hypothetical protein